VTELVPHADVVVVAEAVHAQFSGFLFKVKKAARGAAAATMPFVDHNYIIGGLNPYLT
jgi:hypothetical protein